MSEQDLREELERLRPMIPLTKIAGYQIPPAGTGAAEERIAALEAMVYALYEGLLSVQRQIDDLGGRR